MSGEPCQPPWRGSVLHVAPWVALCGPLGLEAVELDREPESDPEFGEENGDDTG